MTIKKQKHPLWQHLIYVAKHKSCVVHLVKFGKELNIQFIFSKREGKGHATETIRELLKYCQKTNLVLVSSMPISDGWYKIAQRFHLKIYS